MNQLMQDHEVLREQMNQAGLQGCEVAEKLGIAPSTFSNILNGRTAFPRQRLWDLCAIFGKKLDDLLPNLAKEIRSDIRKKERLLRKEAG